MLTNGAFLLAFAVNNNILNRLFNYGIGIHLLETESDKVPVKRGEINPKENHISFQCSDMKLIMKNLDEMNIEYKTAVVEDGGIQVDQLFFHDPDGYMIEMCNCQNLPVLPISTCPLKQPKPTTTTNFNNTKNQAPPFYGIYVFFSPLLITFFCFVHINEFKFNPMFVQSFTLWFITNNQIKVKYFQ